MRYTVLWTPPSRNFAAVWNDALDRNGVTVAAHAIDQLLARDPELHGQVRFDTVYTLSVEPIGVDFEVIEADRIVYVLSVWGSSQ